MPQRLLDIPSIVFEAFARCRRAAKPSRDALAVATVARPSTTSRMNHMHGDADFPAHFPYRAHVYCNDATRLRAEALQQYLRAAMSSGGSPHVLFVGELTRGKAGPHPLPQFEIHFLRRELEALREVLEACGLVALVHPLTDDDLADHTTLAQWIGPPLELDLGTLDPPGHNQGVARFGVSDF
jgi:DOPA 4,5-dioxygenase